MICSCQENKKKANISKDSILEIESKLKKEKEASKEKIEILEYFKNHNLYEISKVVENPIILGDFNRDGKTDKAVLVSLKNQDWLKRILIFHSKNSIIVVGEKDDIHLNWVSFFELNNSRLALESIFNKDDTEVIGEVKKELLGDAIYIGKEDYGALGTIYWNGEKYIYINEGH